MDKPLTLHIFGVPMDLGQNRRGVDMGPSAIRYAGLQDHLANLGYQTRDGGNILVPQPEELDKSSPPAALKEGRAYHVRQIAQACREVYARMTTCLQHDELVVFLGGDHSISIGTVAAVAAQGEIGLVWIDAHADMNTPLTTPSGNVHGMAMAVLLGDGDPELTEIGAAKPVLAPDQVAMVGVRSLDPEERLRLLGSGVSAYTMRQIDEGGIGAIAHQILKQFAHLDHIHVSFDLDSLDPSIAPGVGTPVSGGLSYREAHLLMEILADSGKVRSMDIVEVNPILDIHNQTASVAVELAASLFGKRIL